jgi:hypothetical protein
MRITIDTKEDSHDDIRKVLNILHHLVESKSGFNVSETINSEHAMVQSVPANDEQTASMMGMFESAPTQYKAANEEIPEKAPDFSSFLNLAKSIERKEPEDESKIEFF